MLLSLKEHIMKSKFKDIYELISYYDNISGKIYDITFMKDESKVVRPIPEIPDIIELNRDMEHYMIKSTSCRTELFKDDYDPLTFVHFSDVHAMLELWDRIVTYVNHYNEYISFALHTGDYCGGSQGTFRDFYKDGIERTRPFLNCVGNHDTITPDHKFVEKKLTYEKLFSNTDGWDVEFADLEYSMTYFKDFPDRNIRLIVLDNYYDIDKQVVWLKDLLTEAKEKGYHVITAMHEPTAPIVDHLDTGFDSITDYDSIDTKHPTLAFESVIAEFIAEGGNFVCNLAGHDHHDSFGYTEAGVLNVVVEGATDWAAWTDGVRTRGTRLYDCFNVMTVDTVMGVIKLVRIGDNVDHFMRSKRALCYDYVNKKLISSI